MQGSEESGGKEIQRRVNFPYIRERTGFSSSQVQRMKGRRWKCKALTTMQRGRNTRQYTCSHVIFPTMLCRLDAGRR